VTSVPARWLPIWNFTPLTLTPALTVTWRVFTGRSAPSAATGDCDGEAGLSGRRGSATGCRVPVLLRCETRWHPLVLSFGVIDPVKLIDLRLELTEGRNHGLLVEEAEQCLMETLVLALRGRLVGLAGDRRDTELGDVIDELAHDPPPAATSDATARREWSSTSWRMTDLRLTVRTYSVASSSQHAFGAEYPNLRNDARDSVAFDGAGNPVAIIFACTLIGP
jgi:hypothetical protein